MIWACVALYALGMPFVHGFCLAIDSDPESPESRAAAITIAVIWPVASTISCVIYVVRKAHKMLGGGK